jgi:hypothetical protein
MSIMTLSFLGQVRVGTGFLVSFYDDDMSPLLLRYLHIIYHLVNEADADNGGEEEEVADDEGGDVVGGPGQLSDLVHD